MYLQPYYCRYIIIIYFILVFCVNVFVRVYNYNVNYTVVFISNYIVNLTVVFI